MRMRILGIAALVVIAAIGTAAADSNHPTWYAGVGIGQTDLEVRSGIAQPSIPPQFQSFSDEEDLTKIFIGYKPIKYFAIEGSLFTAGDYSTVFSESSPGAGDGFAFNGDISGYDVSALGIFPFMDRRIEIYGRLGVQRDEFSYRVRDQLGVSVPAEMRDSFKQTNRMYGLGVQVNFGSPKNFGARLEYNEIDSKDTINDMTETLLGFVYGWGGK